LEPIQAPRVTPEGSTPEAWLELPDSWWLPESVSIGTGSAADLSEDWLCRLPEEEAEEEAEEDSSLDIRLGAEKQESHSLPLREDLRVREKSKEKGK
jgi:hypothetical protein